LVQALLLRGFDQNLFRQAPEQSFFSQPRVKPIRKTIVNCGVSHVSACVFAKEDDGTLVLEQTETEDLQYDYSNDSLWLDALAGGLEKLVDRGIGKGEAHFILPGSLLLTKTIRAPRVEESKQRQIVAFELQQKMPYPLAELIWDYQVVEDDGVEQEVLAIAVRPAIAESFCEKVDALGLNPVELSAASILDYNALRHSLLEMRGEETLVINIGAKSTNLLFINPEGFLIRNIALGGNSLTQHVADSIGVPFTKAEQVKKSFFSGEVAFSSDDPAVQVLEKNAEQFKARLSQEVTRSVVTYKRLKKGKSPTRVFLCGKGSLLPGLPEYLSQKQALAVDYFDPLRSVKIGSKIDPEILPQLPFMLSEVVGEACRVFAVGETSSYRGINLLPKDKLAHMTIRKKRWWLAAAAVILSLVPLPSVIGTMTELSQAEQMLAEKKGQLRQKQLEVSEQVEKQQGLLALDHFARAIDREISPLQTVSSGADNWRLLLADLQTLIINEAREVWLDELYVQREASGSKKPVRGRASKDQNLKPNRVLVLNGRFLVRDLENESSRENLIQINSARQKALTESLERCEFAKKILNKQFETEGRGDLFNRFYTYFHYEIELKGERSL
jgi:type IV pilus assembly protein PilM